MNTLPARIIGVLLIAASVIHAQELLPAALTGTASSVTEGLMAGVMISARRSGSTVTVSVPTDDKGRFSFPASRLGPGRYQISVRAVGFDLQGSRSVNVTTRGAASLDVRLTPAKDVSRQLSNAEWLMTIPGSDQQKKDLLDCISCHDLDLIVNSTHNSAQFVDVFNRMVGYYPGSTPQHPQRLIGTAQRNLGDAASLRKLADYLATINLNPANLNQGQRRYPLRTLPRLTGASSRVIITEYALPRPQIQPHDVIVDAQGIVWYSYFDELLLGRLDTSSGEVREFRIPELKRGFPVGTLDMETDPSGNLWIGLMYQSGVARFDKRTETFRTWSVPKAWQTDAAQTGMVEPSNANVDGKVWVKNSDGGQILRLDPETGTWENLGSFSDGGKRLAPYTVRSDVANNLYLLDFRSSAIGRVDARTGQFTAYSGEIVNSRPRRGSVDGQNRLWFGEYAGNAIGMFDPALNKITEWVMPTPWAQPYDVAMDKTGRVWTGSMMNDRVARLDPKTGAFIEYQLPKTTNIRRLFFDNHATPGALWIGSNHGASIIKVEPLD